MIVKASLNHYRVTSLRRRQAPAPGPHRRIRRNHRPPADCIHHVRFRQPRRLIHRRPTRASLVHNFGQPKALIGVWPSGPRTMLGTLRGARKRSEPTFPGAGNPTAMSAMSEASQSWAVAWSDRGWSGPFPTLGSATPGCIDSIASARPTVTSATTRVRHRHAVVIGHRTGPHTRSSGARIGRLCATRWTNSSAGRLQSAAHRCDTHHLDLGRRGPDSLILGRRKGRLQTARLGAADGVRPHIRSVVWFEAPPHAQGGGYAPQRTARPPRIT
jgi:hypothetical protein